MHNCEEINILLLINMMRENQWTNYLLSSSFLLINIYAYASFKHLSQLLDNEELKK